MFTSHLRGHQRHKLRNDEDDEADEQQVASGGQSQKAAAARRNSWREQQRVPPIHNSYYQRDEPLLSQEEDEQEDDRLDWRQNAQMLTERDEMFLLTSTTGDTTDVAPVNRRRLQQQQQQQRLSHSPSSSHTQNRSPTPQQQLMQNNKSASQLASRMVFSPTSKSKRNKKQQQSRNDQNDDELELQADDNSSISFAQSGCHSILSAWRLKAANRNKRQQQQQQAAQRPTSVLSNASSNGRKSVASTAYTLASRLSGGAHKPASALQARIPLGPKSAQHFVTNSRRRRRANELILNTLEARRRALSLNRQQNLLLGGGGSLFGSESFLLAPNGDPANTISSTTPDGLVAPTNAADYQRLSLSPSPLMAPRTGRSPSPAQVSSRATAASRGALSDLGGRQSPLVRSVQGNKMQNFLLSTNSRNKSRSQSSLGARPPLAKLDQNSSDLCSSNDSSSGGSSSSSSSDSSGESQFTQLVTSELAPGVERALLGHEQLRPQKRAMNPKKIIDRPAPTRGRVESPIKRHQAHESTSKPPPLNEPPKPPVRARRKQQDLNEKAATSQKLPQGQIVANRRTQERPIISSDEEDERNGEKLRRGALKRDSIRRLRMSRQSFSGDSKSASSTSASSRDEPSNLKAGAAGERELASSKMQPLSKSRKLDIETNPFLNRHHFRTLSQRSSDSLISTNQQRRPVTPSGNILPTRRLPQASPSNERPARGEQPAEVRQVERMLRQMRPNQVIESRSLTSEQRETRNQSSERHESNLSGSKSPSRPSGREDLVIVRGGRSSPPTRAANKFRSTSLNQSMNNESKQVPKQQISDNKNQLRQQKEEDYLRGRNEFRTTTRLVREGARSSDELKFDLSGNKRALRLDERWRHELEERAPSRQANGALVWGATQTTASERFELINSAGDISPPAEFSDRRAEFLPKTPPPAQTSARQLRPTTPTRTLTTGGGGGANKPSGSHFISASSSQAASAMPPRPPNRASLGEQQEQARRGGATNIAREFAEAQRKTGATTAAASYQRPISPPTRRVAQRNSSSEQVSAPSRASGGTTSTTTTAAAATRARLLQQAASLPKFERTADDEFRKRVDQLRQLARAHLQDESTAAPRSLTTTTPQPTQGFAATAASRRKQMPAPLKPPSLNWRPEGTASEARPVSPNFARGESSIDDLRPVTTSGEFTRSRFASSSLLNSSAPRARSSSTRVESTNLDDMLLADRYQKPLASGWRRSNSSLASLGSSRVNQRPGTNEGSQRVASPLGQPARSAESILSQSAISVGPREPADAAELVPMRLVVREKSAPRRDFAVVEQRAQVQHLQQVEPAKTRTEPLRELQQRPAAPSRQLATQPNVAINQMARQQAMRRSPEFNQGIMNSSSNDDSAIASSVSSPSLSFQQQQTLPVAATAVGAQQQQQQKTLVGPSQTTNLRAFASTTTTTAPSAEVDNQKKQQQQTSSGALQSILRRQQQQMREQDVRGEPASQLDGRLLGLRDGGSAYLMPISSSTSSITNQVSSTKTTSTLTRELISSPQQQQQHQQQVDLLDRSRSAPQPEVVQQQQQQQLSAAPVQKRVHFNDRTSVRSFESLSSENSNSTAIHNGTQQQQANMTAEQQRQLIGSPDSMGSGSTSRLSCDSPDFRRSTSGAAIYAIRGDPELEQGPPPPPPALGVQQQQQQQVFNMQQQQQQQRLASQPLVRYQQTIPMQLATNSSQQQQPTRPVAISIAQQQFNQRQQQQQQLSPQMRSPSGGGCIRMTAPPVISTTSGQPTTVSYPNQVLVSPPIVTARPAQLSSAPLIGQQQLQVGRPNYGEDDDDEYAFRLRQAAANRAFNFIQQQHSPPSSGQQVGGGGGSGQQARSRQPHDLLNFQTEV